MGGADKAPPSIFDTIPSMALSWSGRRQLLYYAVALVLVVVLLFVGYQTFFTAAPTCSDGIRNGTETGVDCGGSCSLVCTAQARAPVILWARAFSSSPQRYIAAAYIQNQNIGAGAKQVHYSFKLLDDKNILVVEREGVADLPPIQTVPIVETNIDIGNRTVARTLFEFTSEPTWNKVSASALPQLHITDQNLAGDGTRLVASVVNDSLNDVRGLTVVAVLFDHSGVARAASKTIIEKIARQSSEPIIFTWAGGFEGVARAEITVLPSF